MRNLGEYPVTDAEILKALDDLRTAMRDENQSTGKVGDLRPTLLEAAMERVKAHPRGPGKIGVNRAFAAYRPKAGRSFLARLLTRS